jgi:SAM-dependent methyltransferase
MKALAMWFEWQDKVKAALPNFCAHPWYVAQPGMYPEFEKTAEYVRDHCPIVLGGKTLGEQYGATLVSTKAQGLVTRMWLDSMCEANFIARHLPLETLRVLDIGAGYGRLAAALGPLVRSYTCTDAVPISTFVCEYFTMKHCPKVIVATPEQLAGMAGMFDLAINIHSWSECSLESVGEWLGLMRSLEINHLFTVTHDAGYMSWSGPSFRPCIENEFSLVAEEIIGLAPPGTLGFPHALWKRK